MIGIKKIINNYSSEIYVLSVKLIFVFSGLLISWYLNEYFSKSTYSYYVKMISWSGLVGLISMQGLDRQIYQNKIFYSKDKLHKHLANNLVSVFAVSLLLSVAIILWSDYTLRHWILLYILSIAFISSQILASYYRVFLRFVAAQFYEKTLRNIGIIVVLLLFGNLKIALFISSIFGINALYIIVSKVQNFKFRLVPKISNLSYHYFIIIIVFVSSNIEAYLPYNTTDDVIASYNIMYRFSTLVLFVVTSLNVIKTVRLNTSNFVSYSKIYLSYGLKNLMVSVLLFGVLYYLSSFVLQAKFKIDADSGLLVFFAAQLIYVAVGPTQPYLFSQGRQKSVFLTHAVSFATQMIYLLVVSDLTLSVLCYSFLCYSFVLNLSQLILIIRE